MRSGNTLYALFALLSSFLFFGNQPLHANETVSANFTIPGNDIVHWSCNFDAGDNGWEVKSTNTEGFIWELRNDLTGSKSFKTIDENDVASYSINGVYAPRYDEQNEQLISPKVTVPANASLKFYGAYSLSYFHSMSIKLLVSDDNAATWAEVWDAETQSTGANAFMFRQVSVNLENYAGKTVQFMWEYKSNVRTINIAGDFVLDGIQLVVPGNKESETINTGQSVKFYNTSEGSPTTLLWEFEGGTPATSTEQSPEIYYYQSGTYAVSLTISNGTSSDKKTIQNMITVEDIAPVAHMGVPTGFKTKDSRRYFVPYKEAIQFYDKSENYPSTWDWIFDGGNVITPTDIERPIVCYDQPGRYAAALTVENSKGNDVTFASIEAGSTSFVWNFNPDERVTYLQMDENQYFPGNNKKFDAYAEYFDAPAIPMLLDSVEIGFIGHAISDDITIRIKHVTVKIFKAEDGQPVGEYLAWGLYDLLDIEYDAGMPSGIYYGSELPIVIDFPFFIVVTGIPMEAVANYNLTIGMAPWRNYGNTAYMREKGEENFVPAYSYFGADKHTSYYITPRMKYLILAPEDNDLTFNASESQQTVNVTATHAWSAQSSDPTWCNATISTGKTIADAITITCNANTTGAPRDAIITLTNGAREKRIQVKQTKDGYTGLEDIQPNKNTAYLDLSGNLYVSYQPGITSVSLYTIDGKKVWENTLNPVSEKEVFNVSSLQKGIYILIFENSDIQTGIKIIK